MPLIRLRSAMFPYNYTLLAEANETGMPMMRAHGPRLSGRPDRTEDSGTQFMWGPTCWSRRSMTRVRRARERLSAGRQVGPLLDDEAVRGTGNVQHRCAARQGSAVRARGQHHPDATHIPTPSRARRDSQLLLLAVPTDRGGIVHALRRRPGDLSLRARGIVLADVPHRAARRLGLVRPFHRRGRRLSSGRAEGAGLPYRGAEILRCAGAGFRRRPRDQACRRAGRSCRFLIGSRSPIAVW